MCLCFCHPLVRELGEREGLGPRGGGGGFTGDFWRPGIWLESFSQEPSFGCLVVFCLFSWTYCENGVVACYFPVVYAYDTPNRRKAETRRAPSPLYLQDGKPDRIGIHLFSSCSRNMVSANCSVRFRRMLYADAPLADKCLSPPTHFSRPTNVSPLICSYFSGAGRVSFECCFSLSACGLPRLPK